jgi:hypothetical protein
LTLLSNELGDIPHKIWPLPWTGANSIFDRDKAAHVLAEHLAAEHAEHPQATQLVIAHSHGGNIALRALRDLQKRDASQSCGADSANPLVVTLATPFVEVHHADFGNRPRLIRLAVVAAIALPLWPLARAIFPMDVSVLPMLIIMAVSFVLFQFISSYWFSERADARRQNQVEDLADATRLGEIVSAQAQRLLIIRAIDDEASLVLGLGTIGNYVTTRAIRLVFRIGSFFILFLLLLLSLYKGREGDAVKVIWSALILILLGLLSVARAAHGRELAKSPMGLQVNTKSTPDGIGLSKIVTLVRRTYAESLRHGVYDHEDCAKTILDWVRSQLPSRL